MQTLRNEVAPLANTLPGVRMACVLLLALSLSACVTLPGAPNANASGYPGDSVQTAISSGVLALGDFFSPEVRELKKLVTEAKMDEALAFAKSKEAYFEDRYKTNSAAPAEFVSLAEHVLATDWRPKLLSARVALNMSLNFESAQAQGRASEALKAADEAQAVVEQALLYKITRVGLDEVASLGKARDALKARALAAKPDAAAALFNEVLVSAKDSYPYVGDLSLSPSDFADSPAFQSAVLARLRSTSDRREFELLTGRLRHYLSADSRVTLDEQFVDMVRKAFMADGRISLEELAELADMKTPIGNAPSALKGMVKVGLANTVRKTGTREFPVGTQKDLSFDLEDAADAMLTQRDGSAFDFIYMVSILDARVERETGTPQLENSRYRAGTDREPNPAYEQARQRLSRAEENFREVRAKASQSSNTRCPPGSMTCALALVAIEYGVASAQKDVTDARTLLETTPRIIEKPRIASYQYRLVPQTVKKAVSGVAVLWDVKGRHAWVMPAEHTAQQSFHLVQGVHGADENRDTILGRADKPQAAERFARAGMELSLSSLFAQGRLSSARKESAMDAVAVLQLVNQEYDRNAPQDDPPSVGRVFKLPG